MQVGSLVEVQRDMEVINAKKGDVFTVKDLQKHSLEIVRHNNAIGGDGLSEFDMRVIATFIGDKTMVIMLEETKNVYLAVNDIITGKPNFVEVQEPINVNEITKEIEEPCMI